MEDKQNQLGVDEARAEYIECERAVINHVWSLPWSKRVFALSGLARIMPGFSELRTLRRAKSEAFDRLGDVWYSDANADVRAYEG